MKKIFFWLACIATALMAAGSLWFILYAANVIGRPDFIQKEMAIFKFNFDGRGLGFMFPHGSVKGRDDARILGWGYGDGWGPGPSETKTRRQFLWLCWTLPNGRIYFELSSDVELTEQDIKSLTESEWNNKIGERSNGIRITTPGYWRNSCSHETGEMVYDKKEVLNEPLAMLNEQMSSPTYPQPVSGDFKRDFR